jgi:hypothetical protein
VALRDDRRLHARPVLHEAAERQPAQDILHRVHSKTKLILSPFFTPILGNSGDEWYTHVSPRIRVQAKARQGRCRRADATRCARTRMLSST